MNPVDSVINDSQRCLRCAGCVAVCPFGAIFFETLDWRIRPERCTRCNRCVLFCPVEALR